MNPQLLHRTASECITGSNQDFEIVLQEPKADFAQIRGFSNSIYSDESHGVWIPFSR